MIKITDLEKIYRTEEVETVALNKLTIEVKEGEFVAIMGPYLAENEKTSFTAFRPLNDTVTWAFIGDDDWMMKDDGTRFYAWGIDEPLLPAPRVANQTLAVPGDTIETGTYTTAVTQLRFDNSNDI